MLYSTTMQVRHWSSAMTDTTKRCPAVTTISLKRSILSCYLSICDCLKSRQSVDMPVYRTNNRRTNAVQRVEPKPLIIVEGIFALYHPQLLKLYHSKVFVETPNDLVRLNRRIVRDFLERGHSEADIRKVWEGNVLPTHYRLIQPQREHADIVVSGEAHFRQSLEQVFAACALVESVGLIVG